MCRFTFVPIPAEMFPFGRAAEEKMQAISEIVRIVAGTLTDGRFFFFSPEVKEPLSPRRQVLSRTQEEEEKKKSEKKVISLTRLALQKTRMSKAQKKTAMTPVPMRITISTLALSLEPRHNKRRQRRQLITL